MTLASFNKRFVNLKTAVALLIIADALFFLSTTTADADLWGYLAFGRLFWGRGHFPYTDVFAYVPTLNLWVYHEWLTGVLFYPIYQIMGGVGLQLRKYLLGLATIGLVYLTARRRGSDSGPAALVLFATIPLISIGYGPVRAQVFTYFFFALYLYLLETARLTKQWHRLWLLVPIQVVWCNLHGGFLAGLGLVLLYALGEALSRHNFRPYLWWFLLAAAASLINPYGLRYWSYLFHAITMPRPDITEWVSIIAGYRTGYLDPREFFNCLALIYVGFMLAWWARWREITPMLVLLVTLFLGLRHIRHLVFFGLAFEVYLPVLLTAYFQKLMQRPGLKIWVPRLVRKTPTLVLVVLLIGLFSYRIANCNPLQLKIPAEPNAHSPTDMYYPVGAVEYIQRMHLSGKLLVRFGWGEYCLWKLYPQCRIAIDGRYETVYPHKVTKPYFNFLFARKGWLKFLQEYPPNMILIDIRSALYTRLSNDPHCRQLYTDSGCALFRYQGETPGRLQVHK
jgi:hypothetical protein